MAKKTKKERSTSKRVKKAATKASVATCAANSVRSKAAQRTAEGKFNKITFRQIGRKECPRFEAMTWKERDAFMAKPENAVVRERYERHMASVLGNGFRHTWIFRLSEIAAAVENMKSKAV